MKCPDLHRKLSFPNPYPTWGGKGVKGINLPKDVRNRKKCHICPQHLSLPIPSPFIEVEDGCGGAILRKKIFARN